jgi:cyclopropane fatty-acyl-phospholipid synthase-like methyltransferase
MVNWNLRYSSEDYFYGEEPNRFLEEQRHLLHTGMSVLVPADGEGRNGVWLATLGLDVHTVDGAASGVQKSMRLAAQQGVELRAEQADLFEWSWPEAAYDVIVSVFFHMPSAQRPGIHTKMLNALKPGGLLILEAFHQKQLQYRSGGPKDKDLLYTEELLRADFQAAEIEMLETCKTELNESDAHRGEAIVVRMLARRPVA